MAKFVSLEAPPTAVGRWIWKQMEGGIYSSECTDLMRDCNIGQRGEVTIPC